VGENFLTATTDGDVVEQGSVAVRVRTTAATGGVFGSSGLAGERTTLPRSGSSTRRGISDPNGGLKLINKSRDARLTSAIAWMKGGQVLTRLA
jgi:hypothetical protein